MATTQAVESALRGYIERVAALLGLDSGSASCEVAEWASGYIALARRLPRWPDHDVALPRDQRHGWAPAV
ncbi:DUF6292 family protein [Sciscionella marina]|uniref:DUF6292 family protein n=1 Tax=Sciscionella marina TaxID=508770 RepID=UPI0003763AC9|nr:DUF6292 family protein [Sciscionella marina]